MKAWLLKGNPVNFKEEKNITFLSHDKLPNENDAVVVLEMNGNVENIPMIENSGG